MKNEIIVKTMHRIHLKNVCQMPPMMNFSCSFGK
jgi:hypothetical protein